MGQTRQAAGGRYVCPSVALVIWLVAAFAVIGLAACSENGSQAGLSKNVKIIVDVTKSTPPAQARQYYRFVRNLIDRLEAQDRVTVLAITESSFSRPRILLEGSIPTDDRELKPRVLAARDSLAKQWSAIADSLVPRYEVSDVLGAIEYASLLFKGVAGANWLIILSDYRNSTPGFNLEDMEAIEVESSLARLGSAGLIPNLRGVRVVVLGLHTEGKDMRYYESMEAFVRAYVGAAQAELVEIRADVHFTLW